MNLSKPAASHWPHAIAFAAPAGCRHRTLGSGLRRLSPRRYTDKEIKTSEQFASGSLRRFALREAVGCFARSGTPAALGIIEHSDLGRGNWQREESIRLLRRFGLFAAGRLPSSSGVAFARGTRLVERGCSRGLSVAYFQIRPTV